MGGSIRTKTSCRGWDYRPSKCREKYFDFRRIICSPKIANYPFTTLIPNLGVVRKIDGNGCLFADIPGLISGAADGVGLGYDFLRHIQRTKILVHLIDAVSENPLHDFEIIEQELKKYGKGLLDKERICLLYTSPSPRDATLSRMPSSA